MDLIYPEIFRNAEHIEGLFTAANKTRINSTGVLKGMNFGINTDEEDQVISENFNRLFAHLGWEKQKVSLARQVHGNRIACVEQAGIYEDCDGLVTARPGLPLGIQVADCAAILVADPLKNIIGAFHAGWRGAVSGIVPEGIETMMRLRAEPKNCKVYISPCITLQNFEVGEEVAAQFPDEYCDRENFNKPHIDLKKFIYHQLLDCGLLEENIESSTECTVSNRRFFSYRRERSEAGRMLGLIKIKS